MLKDKVQEWLDYKNENGYTSALDDLLQNGCVSGMVPGLICYHDTCKFYEENKIEINDLLRELIDETGLSVGELFGDKWDDSDPLAFDVNNKNLLAWFGFEETARMMSEA